MRRLLRIASGALLLLAGAFLILTLLARGDGAPPRAIAVSGAALQAAPGARFVHHRGEAREIVFLPDGTIAATGTDGRIELVDPEGRVRGTMIHEGGASPLALSPDGSLLASGGYDRAVRIWRLADRRQSAVLADHGGTVWTLAWSPDGQWLASAGEDKTIRIWRAADRALVHVIPAHDLNIWSLRFSPDSRLLASGSFDRSIRLWDVGSGRLVRRLAGHDQAVVSVAFSPDGRLLASGGDDSMVRIWRVADGRQLRVLTGSDHVYAVAFSPDGRWLASGGRARSGFWTFWHQLTGQGPKGPAVRLWRVTDGALQATLEASDDVMALAFSPDGRLLVTGSADGANAAWRLIP
ncbi:MAG TPA: WD40 repeat domain-containing protein [Allosphingosinicella sp.]|nr:WD40 repeat domain-containing protein [Allosphingosinicella sp.]